MRGVKKKYFRNSKKTNGFCFSVCVVKLVTVVSTKEGAAAV